jgi:hypothetical protein
MRGPACLPKSRRAGRRPEAGEKGVVSVHGAEQLLSPVRWLDPANFDYGTQRRRLSDLR